MQVFGHSHQIHIQSLWKCGPLENLGNAILTLLLSSKLFYIIPAVSYIYQRNTQNAHLSWHRVRGFRKLKVYYQIHLFTTSFCLLCQTKLNTTQKSYANSKKFMNSELQQQPKQVQIHTKFPPHDFIEMTMVVSLTNATSSANTFQGGEQTGWK